MKNILLNAFMILFAAVLNSCEMLPLQTDEKYHGTALDPNTGMSCLEFIESRPDLFTNLREAIKVCELESYYTQTSSKQTYLLLSDKAITTSEVELAKTDAAAKTKLINDLRFHIIQGYYHAYGTLNYDPIFVITCFDSPKAIMTIKLETHISNSAEEGAIKTMELTGQVVRKCVSSNHFFTNGVGHIFDLKSTYVL